MSKVSGLIGPLLNTGLISNVQPSAFCQQVMENVCAAQMRVKRLLCVTLSGQRVTREQLLPVSRRWRRSDMERRLSAPEETAHRCGLAGRSIVKCNSLESRRIEARSSSVNIMTNKHLLIPSKDMNIFDLSLIKYK